jgi:hypothetical protein
MALIPPGEYPAVVVSARTVREGNGYALEVHWHIGGRLPGIAANAEQRVLVQRVALPTDASGTIDLTPGRNAHLDLLRHAVGLTQPQAGWTPAMLVGRAARVLVVKGRDSAAGPAREVAGAVHGGDTQIH